MACGPGPDNPKSACNTKYVFPEFVQSDIAGNIRDGMERSGGHNSKHRWIGDGGR